MRNKRSNSKRLAASLPTLIAILGLAAVAVTAGRQADEKIEDIQIAPPTTLGNPDSSTFAGKFPDQYKAWKSTEEMKANTMFGGSNTRDYLAASPHLVVMWAGNAFAKDYMQARGHQHAVEDVLATKRVNDKNPGTCWSCKSTGVAPTMLRDGVEKFYGNKFSAYKAEMGNSIGCADCHEPKTMKLQISRPGLLEGLKSMGRDIKKVSKDEMKSLVCAQCHVEYHFKGPNKYLKLPWNFGLKIEDMDKYYAKTGFSDFTHAISGAKMVKMQHPDFEVFQQSLHGKRGVSCADCHMPTKTSGKKEFTDHQIQSPLYMADRTCGNCHNWTPDQARERVFEIQSRNREMLDRAERTITAAHLEIGDAMKLGATDDELVNVRSMVSKAQMYWDYIAASNGMGFHAPQESARVLGKALDFAQECRLETQAIRMKHGATGAYVMPDISTKELAQAFIKPFVDAANAKAAAAAPK